MQIAGLVVTACVIANIGFYFLSDLYFEDRSAIYGSVTTGHINDVRIAFAIFTGSLGLTSIAAAMRPMWVGHGIAAAASIAAVLGGVSAALHDMTAVLPVALIVTGIVLALLIWKSLEKVRGAWAFLIGMTSVLAAVLLFGATKVRGSLDVGLWIALIIPGMLAVATVALAMTRDDYRET